MPEVSVIIPAYNHAAYIGEAVESVLNQSLKNLELIVVDDGSTDATPDVLARYTDPRMKVIRISNQGAHAAINIGLGQASAPYLAILNSDDAYHTQRLEKGVTALADRPEAGLLGSHIEIIDRKGKILGVKHGYRDAPPWLLEKPEHSFRAGEDLRAALLTENYWATTSNFIFSRRIHERVGAFRPLRYTHDWDFALRCALIAPLILLPEPLVRYRVHPTNTIRENQVAMVFEICWILAVHLPKHLADPEFLPYIQEAGRVDLLLHSIYAFGMEHVLSVLLLEDLQGNPDRALKLLIPDEPTRTRYLAFIEERLTAAPESTVGYDLQKFYTRLKKLIR